MTNRSSLTVSSLMGEIGRLLDDGGYLAIDPPEEGILSSRQARLFEDFFGVVGIVVFETWEALTQTWETAQSELVELISTHFSKGEPKSWDGYLVLITPSPVREGPSAVRIRYDTTRVRKIVAAGEELVQLSDLASILAPLLPLQPESIEKDDRGILVRLPQILSERGIPKEATKALVDAYAHQEPLMECIDKFRGKNEDH